jgi:uncharacterized membrane protein YbhN (UPF0104 family)
VPVLAVLSLAFMCYALASRLLGLHGAASLSPGYLLLGIVFMTAAVVALGMTWIELLERLGGRRSPRGPLLRAFFYCWLGRYIPGTIPFLVMRVEATRRLGYSRAVVVASIAYEQVLQIGVALTVSLALLMMAFGPRAAGFAAYGLILIPLAAAGVCLHPRVLASLANRAARLRGRPEITDELLLTGHAMMRVAAMYAAAVLVNGLGFYFVLRAVAPVSLAEFPAACGAYNLAGVLGILAIFVPSGLGVREGVVTALVGLHQPLEVAATAALLSRAAAVIADVVPAGLLLVTDIARRCRMLYLRAKTT